MTARSRRLFLLVLAVVVGGSRAASAQAPTAARAVEPVVLTGAQAPDWSDPAADTECMPYPSGTSFATFLGGRDAHNGTDVPTKTARAGAGRRRTARHHGGAVRDSSPTGTTEEATRGARGRETDPGACGLPTSPAVAG